MPYFNRISHNLPAFRFAAAELRPHTQIYTLLHHAASIFLFTLFQFGTAGRFWALVGAFAAGWHFAAHLIGGGNRRFVRGRHGPGARDEQTNGGRKLRRAPRICTYKFFGGSNRRRRSAAFLDVVSVDRPRPTSRRGRPRFVVCEDLRGRPMSWRGHFAAPVR